MTTRYVAIDTETTGVDLAKDEIIEVAAIAFGLDGPGGEFRSLVRPLRPPSYQIERLTGIRAEDLESAPRFGTIASELADFIGSSPVIGHNVAFDLGFLERAGVRSRGPAYDTLELAQTVLPAIGAYSLRNVAACLGLAGLAIVLGIVAVRWNIVVPGLTVPKLEGLTEAVQSSRIVTFYSPSLVEWLTTIGLLALFMLLLSLGSKLLPLQPAHPESVSAEER